MQSKKGLQRATAVSADSALLALVTIQFPTFHRLFNIMSTVAYTFEYYQLHFS